MVFHVLNRGVGRMRLFQKDEDYEAFERAIEKTLETRPMRICSYCLMPNHWHFVLWPEKDGQLGEFMQKLTVTHVRNWQEYRRRVGYGHVYQGRYKSFPIEEDEHFFQVMRYVERNALRANLTTRAESWRWCSLWRRVQGGREARRWLAEWPLPKPDRWTTLVNRPQSEAEMEPIRRSIGRGQPFGSPSWTQRTAKALGLDSTLRPRGRPKTRPRR
jgi:putative transposase